MLHMLAAHTLSSWICASITLYRNWEMFTGTVKETFPEGDADDLQCAVFEIFLAPLTVPIILLLSGGTRISSYG